MTDNVIKFPADQVLDTLIDRHAENKEKTGSMNGELGDRLRTQYDLFKHFTPFGWRLISSISWTFRSNELKARDMLRAARAALDFAERWMDRHGHTGDIVELAEAKAKGKKAPKGKSEPKTGGSFTEEQRAETAKGDELIKDNLKDAKPTKIDKRDLGHFRVLS